MAISDVYLQDLLSQVIANPTAPIVWHKLRAACLSADEERLVGVVGKILSGTPPDGPAGLLRATFLSSLTEDGKYLREAAALLREITPFNMDRLITFCIYGWAQGLLRGNGRATFLSKLLLADVPGLVAEAGEYLEKQIPISLPRREISGLRKVAILSPQLSAVEHAPTLLAIHHAQMLIDNGLSVQLFATQELQPPEFRSYLGGGEHFAQQPPFDPLGWKSQSVSEFRYHVCNNNFSLMARYGDMLRFLSEYDPDLILFVGFFSPLLSTLFRQRPVVGLSVHTLPPVGPVDIWLSADRGVYDPSGYAWSLHFRPPEKWHYPYRIKLRNTESRISRRGLGLKEDGVVLVTVGDRLEDDIKGDWAASMASFLRENKKVQWLLVGDKGIVPQVLQKEELQSVRAVPHSPDERAIFCCCQIYVNPPRMGGGFSVATAMAEGLPVVAYAASDGGDKIGEAASFDDKSYFGRLARLAADPAARSLEGEVMQRLFSETLDLGQAGPSLMKACAEAMEHYNARVMGKRP